MVWMIAQVGLDWQMAPWWIGGRLLGDAGSARKKKIPISPINTGGRTGGRGFSRMNADQNQAFGHGKIDWRKQAFRICFFIRFFICVIRGRLF
jgi:hypothetical protein